MTQPASIGDLVPATRPALVLAPMQEVTHLPFWRVLHRYGGPDIYFTEYFRAHETSRPNKDLLRCLDENPSGRPAIAQMIGCNPEDLVRMARALQKHPVAGIDLNLGCPAPIVYSKEAGGGLLRNPERIDQILSALRDAIEVNFTVKTRVGFHSHDEFRRLLDVFARHPIDALTIHGRTVAERYSSAIHYPEIRAAVERMDCPVIANGNIVSSRMAQHTIKETGAAGLMIGRGCIRNPWVFSQIASGFEQKPIPIPTCRDMLGYIRALYEETQGLKANEARHVAGMKRFLTFIGQSVDEEGEFLYRIKRVTTEFDFFQTCEEFFDNDEPWPEEPPLNSKLFAGLV